MLNCKQITDAAITKDLSKLDDILSTWRQRRWLPEIKDRKRVDFTVRFALQVLERAYPGKVWPELTLNECDLVDAAYKGCYV